MAKKIKDEVAEVITNTVEEVKEGVEEFTTKAMEVVEEVKEAVVAFAEGTKVEIVNFYVRAFNGLKGTVTGTDESGNALVELEGGSKAVFKADNLQKAE